METALLNEIIDCLPKDRTVFRYARDDYALMLLANFTAGGKAIADIKQSAFRSLLNKPRVKSQLANCGQGVINRDYFDYVYAEDRQDFVLTVGRWDRSYDCFSQTTRGSANLVIQVNFNTGHDNAFDRWVGEDEHCYFATEVHPILREGERPYHRYTLGWARLDLDFATGEALIEEIQTDWLRDAKWFLRFVQRRVANNPRNPYLLGEKITLKSVTRYMDEVLAPYYKIWDEAILTAALQFCMNELGLRNIYYHTFETGNKLKKLNYSKPPRSLYTDLPKKFCFQQTDTMPEFLAKSRVVKRKMKKLKDPHWFSLVM